MIPIEARVVLEVQERDNMKVLVIGSGGREHVLVKKVSESKKVNQVFVLPGNPGMKDLATLVDLPIDDFSKIINFVKENQIDLTIVGPEAPLSAGIVDAFQKEGLKIFGPSQKAAIIEASKCFTKEFCEKYHIPTAGFKIFSEADQAKKYLKENNQFPIVLKADGLAAGKGVIIAKSLEEANQAVDEMMLDQKFGQAGDRIVIEDFMPGEEASYMVVTDGDDFIVLASSQDHKAVFDNDEGPNTGGMGAYSPAPVMNKELEDQVNQSVIKPLLEGMKAEGRKYIGIVYAGLMISDGQARVVEFNCRFGDPEAQVILHRMDSDLVELIEACIENRLSHYEVKFTSDTAVCVVLAAPGYPGSYEKGLKISGLLEAGKLPLSYVYHAGTKLNGDDFVTNGGRVLGVTSLGKNLSESIKNVYDCVNKISWPGIHYRKDIGAKGLKRLSN